MAGKDDWQELLNKSLFAHIIVEQNIEDRDAEIDDFLETVYTLFFSNDVSFDRKNPAYSLPDNNTSKETIGANATQLRTYLSKLKVESGSEQNIAAQYQYLDSYLQDSRFECYVNNLLNFFESKALSELPEEESGLPSLEIRKEETERDNHFDLSEIADKAEKARRLTESAQSAAESAQKAAESAQKATESVMPNMLTTLGVFIAIVIAVVACYLSLLLAQHFDPSKDAQSVNMATILLMGQILLNIIFLLLYLISKMSGHTLACNCSVGNKMNCGECEKELRERCHWGNKLWLRYPYIVLLNGISILAYFCFGLWSFFTSYLLDNVTELLKSNDWIVAGAILTAVLGGGCLSILVIELCFLSNPAKKLKRQTKKNEKKQKKVIKKERRRSADRYIKSELNQLRHQLNQHEQQIVAQKNYINQLHEQLEVQHSAIDKLCEQANFMVGQNEQQ